MLRQEDWRVNHKRIERLWHREGLKVPARQPKRKRLWLGDGSCVRLRPVFKNHVWSYNFVHAQTHDGQPLRLLTLFDEYSRECLASDVSRRMASENVLERLSDLFIHRGVSRYLRSDNGPSVVSSGQGENTLHRAQQPPGERHYRILNGKLRDELLNGEIFETMLEAKLLIERWRVTYNTIRPPRPQNTSALGYQPPAPDPLQRTGLEFAADRTGSTPPTTLRLHRPTRIRLEDKSLRSLHRCTILCD